MVETIISFLGTKALGQAQVVGMSGIVFLVANWILSHYKIPDKLSKWLRSAEVHIEAFFDKIIIGAGVWAFNFGVSLTMSINQTPVLSWIYEKLIEPLIIIITESVVRIFSIILDKLSTLIMKMCNKFIVGLKSDNKNFEVNDESGSTETDA